MQLLSGAENTLDVLLKDFEIQWLSNISSKEDGNKEEKVQCKVY